MVTRDQVIAQIRFGLEQLSSRNAHHEFEHLCRGYAKRRICLNIHPATGPVSAAGDQGKDFESYRCHIDPALPGNESFAGLVADKYIAFPCTIQKSRLDRKVKDDVLKIDRLLVIPMHQIKNLEISPPPDKLPDYALRNVSVVE